MLADNRPTRAHIHLDRLAANYLLARRLAETKTVMAVVKADAYGHGALPVSRRLEAEGCRWFGVATLDEAIALRSGGITGEILLLGGLFPGDEAEAIRNGVACTVYDDEVAQRLHAAARKLGERAAVHLKVDTGMSRLGFDLQGFSGFLRSLSDLDGLAVRGLFSHLAEADRAESQVTEEQCSLLSLAHRSLLNAVGEVAHLHLGSSSSLLARRMLPGDMIRPGIMLYGAHPLPPEARGLALEPVLEFTSSLVQIRRVAAGRKVSYGGTWVAPIDSTLGIVPAGYGDGVPRLLSNRGEVLVAGRRVPIRGRVCMDMLLVDLTGIEDVGVGQLVTLLGRQGEACITAEEWAGWAETIPYEIFCNVSKRVPRVYTGGGQGIAST